MPRDKQQILDDLMGLDLSRYPFYEFEGLMDEMKIVPGLHYTLHPGKRLTRACAVRGTHSKAEITYSPHKYSTKCLRANISGYPMFYGSISDANDVNFINTRLAACCECSGLLRGDPNTKGMDPITFGRWVVTEDINLFAIVSDDQFIVNNPYYQELHEFFLEETAKQENMDDFLRVASFWGHEFSNPNI